jgi:hypothetical protein
MASGSCASGTVTDGGGNLSVTDAAFTNPDLMAWEDFALTASSPGIDQGDPGRSTAWDFTGRARPIDGDDSGSAEPDVGAMEYQP